MFSLSNCFHLDLVISIHERKMLDADSICILRTLMCKAAGRNWNKELDKQYFSVVILGQFWASVPEHPGPYNAYVRCEHVKIRDFARQGITPTNRHV